jgi:hypothetical protein
MKRKKREGDTSSNFAHGGGEGFGERRRRRGNSAKTQDNGK